MRKPLGAVAGTALLIAILQGCAPLPRPFWGLKGHVREVTEGSAFGVSTGMSIDVARRILAKRGDLVYRGVECYNSDEKSATQGVARVLVTCPGASSEDVYNAHCFVTECGTLIVYSHEGAVYRLRWWAYESSFI